MPSERSGGVGTTLQASPRPDGSFEFINVSPGDYLLQTGFPGVKGWFVLKGAQLGWKKMLNSGLRAVLDGAEAEIAA